MKIGVIGLGSIGARHAQNLHDLGHAVMGWDPKVSDWNYDMSKEQILEQSDAIVIASPTDHHYEHICDARRYDKPAFVEKPISVTREHLATYRSIKMVGYNLRFHSCVQKAQEWLPRIGKPLWANFTCAQFNNKPAYLRDGVILNWSHEIDLALHLLGTAHLESSSTRIVDGCDDMTDIALSHESGCRTMIHLDYVTKPEKRFFVIVGEEGEIFVNLPNRYIALYADRAANLLDSYWDEHGSYDKDYKTEMQAFITRVEGKGDTHGCTGEEALKVLEICLQVRKQAGL